MPFHPARLWPNFNWSQTVEPPTAPIDVAFTSAIRAVQHRKGSADACGRLAMGKSITEALAQFIATRTSLYLASASADGQPYVQHRGGPAGFLRVLDETTLAFADFRGNKQYISTGNFSENPKAFIFLMAPPTSRASARCPTCQSSFAHLSVWTAQRHSRRSTRHLRAERSPQGRSALLR